MGSFFAEIVAELLEWYLDIKFWFKKRKRRKFEKENNLPKKSMMYPSTKIEIVATILFVFSVIVFMFFISPSIKKNKTKNKLIEIAEILEQEKSTLNYYPKKIEQIIRNNPLRRALIKDSWGNTIQYKLTDNNKNYMLFSVGKDGVSNTKDDIFFND